MNRQNAEQLITEYIKPVFGFAVKRCRSIQDAEDLSQEIILKVFRTLTLRDDIADPEKYIWRIARNCLVNYYRGKGKQSMGIPLEDISELSEPAGFISDIEDRAAAEKLQSEIAYLSKLQRRIVIAYYYENKKQSEIAAELNIPLGTVKWHLFEAKKELKRGMEMERKASELKFNPVVLDAVGVNGSVGEKGGADRFLRSALSQNIVYLTLREPKTVTEIADSLGVSPVYAESEAEYLEEYGFLIKQGDKYLSNVLIDEPNAEINDLHDKMYEKAAELFANDLYDELVSSGILDDDNVKCDVISGGKRDINYLLWALIPYIAALSGEKDMDGTVSFEEAATPRPDGGNFICCASVKDPDATPVKYAESMRKWCGPCWTWIDKITLWQINSEWSAERSNYLGEKTRTDLLILKRLYGGEKLTEEEYSVLAEQGYIKYENGQAKSLCAVIDTKTKAKLLTFGDRIKAKYQKEFEELKAPFVNAVMEHTPQQLKKARQFGHQYIFYSDGWFLLYCLKTLTENGKLKPPSEEQKKSLATVIVME